MLPADLAPVATPALTPWGMYLAADVVVKSVRIALALASLATWAVLLAKGCELARAEPARRARRIFMVAAPLARAGFVLPAWPLTAVGVGSLSAAKGSDPVKPAIHASRGPTTTAPAAAPRC
ncbi:hypothetical protein [Stenotrophomonas pavanii]|jgi:hypothetical protein|uniref:Uncharacterized protein n=1 Tax=Stenotrophomonas pavanii TaxID=487698 RepID=A0ABM7R4P3_9GAMM|nr:hypothetical protein [Stenotrophomonas pavanii]MCW8343767.1 hypothetical protein [Stenotrophomonas sp. SG1]MDQ7272603.1 hypothetical protein [Stenotrophomonas sp. Sm3212]UGB18505.1 hypothetical protein LQ332_04730 [Stenotrophomonas maltophilia]UGB49427.1 hypothetical protein LQ330_20815 [Stenotrophomonas maltophilia]BCX45301.1 hypothetical protein STNY_R35210 [Stenotrophomonas pavanii]